MKNNINKKKSSILFLLKSCWNFFNSKRKYQLIGIAKAIYKNAKALVLDEATSALDIDTENEVINSLNKFNKNLTLIMIAHRYSTLQSCDFILRIENTDVINCGSPNNII